MVTEFDSIQYSTFKDCLATRVLSMPEYHGTSAPDVDTEDEGSSLDDFTSYLASSVWPSIPQHIRELTHVSGSIPTREELEDLIEAIDAPSEFVDTLVSYGLVTDESDISSSFLLPVLTSYTSIAAAPPQTTNWSATRSLVDGCELCGRDVPLTYHHLIPRSVHDKAVKRGWHEERMLSSVAWLCRPCHSAIHGMMRNEVLARSYYSVELLMTREDVQKWAKYASRQRWGTKRG